MRKKKLNWSEDVSDLPEGLLAFYREEALKLAQPRMEYVGISDEAIKRLMEQGLIVHDDTTMER